MNTVIFLLSLPLFATARSIVTDAAREEMKRAAEVCQSEYNVSYEKYTSFFRTEQLPSSKDEKCYLACNFRVLGLTRNGLMDVENMKMYHRRKFSDEEVIEKADKTVYACDKKLSKEVRDECDYSVYILACLKEERKKL